MVRRVIRPPIHLRTPTLRQFCASYVLEVAPDGCVVSFKENTRSLEQNARMHAMLDDIAEQVVWHGQKLPAWKWKLMFVYAHNDVEIVPGIEPGSFVPVYRSTTTLGIKEASDYMLMIEAFGAHHDVVFRDLERAR